MYTHSKTTVLFVFLFAFGFSSLANARHAVDSSKWKWLIHSKPAICSGRGDLSLVEIPVTPYLSLAVGIDAERKVGANWKLNGGIWLFSIGQKYKRMSAGGFVPSNLGPDSYILREYYVYTGVRLGNTWQPSQKKWSLSSGVSFGHPVFSRFLEKSFRNGELIEKEFNQSYFHENLKPLLVSGYCSYNFEVSKVVQIGIHVHQTITYHDSRNALYTTLGPQIGVRI